MLSTRFYPPPGHPIRFGALHILLSTNPLHSSLMPSNPPPCSAPALTPARPGRPPRTWFTSAALIPCGNKRRVLGKQGGKGERDREQGGGGGRDRARQGGTGGERQGGREGGRRREGQRGTTEEKREGAKATAPGGSGRRERKNLQCSARLVRSTRASHGLHARIHLLQLLTCLHQPSCA